MLPPLERSGTATRGGLAGDGRAVTTLLWINGTPGDLYGPGRLAGIHGDRDSPTSTDGQSGEGRTGGPDYGRDQALMSQETSEESDRVGLPFRCPTLAFMASNRLDESR